MTAYANQRISDFMTDIQSLSDTWYEMVEKVRQMHVTCLPDVVEEIKYGGLVFFKDKVLVSGIFVYKAHVSIEFGEGATMSDPDAVLEGKGKHRRHIKMACTADIIDKNVIHYVQQALC